MTPEGKVKEKVKRVLRKVGAWYTMPRGGAYGRAGVPDFLCCYKAIFVAIETKFGDNGLTKLQRAQFEAINLAGGLPIVVTERNVDELERFFQVLDQRIVSSLPGKESASDQKASAA